MSVLRQSSHSVRDYQNFSTKEDAKEALTRMFELFECEQGLIVDITCADEANKTPEEFLSEAWQSFPPASRLKDGDLAGVLYTRNVDGQSRYGCLGYMLKREFLTKDPYWSRFGI